MPIPGTQEIRKPLLEAFKGEAPHSFAINDFLELTAGYFGLESGELSSGDKNILKSRITEAKNDLKKNNLISNPSKNTYMITNAGIEVLEDNPDIISDEYLNARNNRTLSESDALGLDLSVQESEGQFQTDDSEITPDDSEPLSEESDMPPEDYAAQEFEGQEDFTDKEFDDAPEENVEPYAEADEAEIQEAGEESMPEFETEEVQESETQEEFAPETEPEAEPELEPEPESEPEQEHEPEPEPEPEPDTEPELPPEPEQESEDEAETTAQGIEKVIARHNAELAEELLNKVADLPSDRFEILVIDLLSKMGYFAFQTARYTTESAGSDLIHGVILDNKTGAYIYIQARKLSPGRTVGRADIQDFVEELADKGGKGIYATTATFSENAKIYANDERIMLIDGERLAGLMIAHNFCVNVEKVYEVKAVDNESFSEYEG